MIGYDVSFLALTSDAITCRQEQKWIEKMILLYAIEDQGSDDMRMQF